MRSRPTNTFFVVPVTSIRKVEADGIQVFYREAPMYTQPNLVVELITEAAGERALSKSF